MTRLTALCAAFLFFAGVACAQTPLVLTNIQTADIQRFDEGQNVRAVITINFVVGPSFKVSFYVNDTDIAAFKNGTAPQKAAIAKAYIRRAIVYYFNSLTPPSPPAEQSSTNVTKAQIQDPGDTP